MKKEKKQNLSIEELAARSHLPKSTVEKVIFGITKDPRRSTIKAIEKALGLNSGYRETMPMEITPLEEELLITFYTRCRECGVADAARDEMVGHSGGRLTDAYTDLSDAFLIREANKIKYDLPPILPPN